MMKDEEFDRITREYIERTRAIDYPVLVIIALNKETEDSEIFYDDSLPGKALAIHFMGEFAEKIKFTAEEISQLENGIPTSL